MLNNSRPGCHSGRFQQFGAANSAMPGRSTTCAIAPPDSIWLRYCPCSGISRRGKLTTWLNSGGFSRRPHTSTFFTGWRSSWRAGPPVGMGRQAHPSAAKSTCYKNKTKATTLGFLSRPGTGKAFPAKSLSTRAWKRPSLRTMPGRIALKIIVTKSQNESFTR